MHLKAGRLEEASAVLESVIRENPENWQSTHLLGLVAYKQGRLKRAADLIRQCLTINPHLAEAYSDLGVVLKEMGELDDAQAACEKAIALKPDFHPAHSNLGNIFKAFGNLEDAADSYRRAIEFAPNFVDAHVNLGATLTLLGKTEEALDVCLHAVELAPNQIEALTAFAHALRASGELEDAIAICRRAVELRPDYGPTYSDLGCVLQEHRQYEEAISAHQRALELKPDYAEAHNNLGIAYKELGRYADALEACQAAIALKPTYADAHSNMGVVLDLVGRHQEALSAYEQAIKLNPKLLYAYINLAGSLAEQDHLSDAIATYAKALTIDPDHPGALVDHYHLRRQACDWDGLAASEQKILSKTYRAGKRVPTFPILNMRCNADDHLLSAREWAKGLPRPVATPFSYDGTRRPSGRQRLRIGYVSGDFYRHATASLIAELIERHDREQFEIFGYCFSENDNSGMRQRVISAFDVFANIGEMSHADAARRINQDGIDILIDLKGYTTGARTEIFACRPAPVQVNYLGYPGTMGAKFIDYIISDEFITPMDQQPFFDEKIVLLPECYQPNDTRRVIAACCPSRAECGLPEDGLVFCSFNNSYKITPEMFAIWMRLLQSVPGSVLWLLECNSLMRENLQRKAASHGVDPGRIVFAPKMELTTHLARHRHADLFLDTLPVNAHTTASDALWAGLPVLTCAGETFVSRVCGSLLKAVGLRELITYSPEEYERVALDYARNPEELADLRKQLVENRQSASLFDIGPYTKALEKAFRYMAELSERGEAPCGFAVDAVEEQEAISRTSATPSASPSMPLAETKAPSQNAPDPSPKASDVRILYEACPLCDSADISFYKSADCTDHPCYNASFPSTISWNRCSSCGHVFSEGYFTPQASEMLFAKTVPHNFVGHDVEAQRFISARIVSQIAKLKPGGDWLDVGFGNASLLFTAEEWGYRPVGIDLRRDNVAALRKLGYETYPMPIQDLDMAGRFNVISMADVLEQTPYPSEALTSARCLLQPGGILFCSMPNMATIVWRMLDSNDSNSYWGEIGHYHNFTRERLYKLLEENGFRPIFYNVSERYRACMDVIAVNG